MKTHETSKALRLAADIIETGHPWETSNGTTWWKPEALANPALHVVNGNQIRPILATPPDNRPIHNPDNLTAEQVGVGWRLALPEEMDGRFSNGKDDCDWWSMGHEWKRTDQVFPHNCPTDTIRLPLSTPWPEAKPDPYAELKKAHAEGKVIQCITVEGDWVDCTPLNPPRWNILPENYRIKPEPTFQLPPPPPGMQWHEVNGWILVVDKPEPL